MSAECSAVSLLGRAGDHTPMPMISIHNQNRDGRKSIEVSLLTDVTASLFLKQMDVKYQSVLKPTRLQHFRIRSL